MKHEQRLSRSKRLFPKIRVQFIVVSLNITISAFYCHINCYNHTISRTLFAFLAMAPYILLKLTYYVIDLDIT